jgi:ADP-ribose pyrophosphatase YjhB (NUDIX family)
VVGPPTARTVATLPEVRFPDGTAAAVELVASPIPAPEAHVFAALVFLQDADDRFAVVYSPRREEWASPGGFREPGESVADTVLREVLEETGLSLAAASLHPCGYERFRPLAPGGRWPAGGGCLQLYRARLPEPQPAMQASEADVVAHRWVTLAEFRALCGAAFWWPLAEALFGPAGPLSAGGGTARGRG